MRAVACSQILILQLLLHFCFSSLHVSVSCLWFLYPMSLFKYFKRVGIFAWPPDPKGQRIVVVVYHHDDIAALLQCNSHVDIVFSDNRVYSNLKLHTPLHMTILQDHVICIGLLQKFIIIADISYCWAEKLMLHRNWAL